MTKGYSDVSLGTLMRRILGKAESAGRQVIFVNPWNTSQECSNCGEIVKKDLSVRTHSCQYLMAQMLGSVPRCPRLN